MNIRNKNMSNLLEGMYFLKINLQNPTQTNEEKELKKTIVFPTANNSYLRLTFDYSERQNLTNQRVFRNNYNFFQEENFESLMKALNNTKKLNLLK